MMCPSSSCTIDTSKPFLIVHTQHVDSAGVLDYVNIQMSQGSNSANFNVCNSNSYVNSMGSSMNGQMVFVASLWGGVGTSMSWLDGVTGCAENCNLGSSSVRFSNFAIENQ